MASAERVLQALHHAGWGDGLSTAVDMALRGQHHAIARHRFDGLTADTFRPVTCRGVKEIQSQVEGLAHQGSGCGFCTTTFEPQATVTSAAEACHAYAEPGVPQRDLFPPGILS